MKKHQLFFLFFFHAFGLQAQNDSLDYYQRDMLFNSTHIFEGVVIDGRSYFNKDSSQIYTSVIVQVNKVFRGKNIQPGTIELVLEGGRIGDQEQILSHGLGLPSGRPLVLFCVPSKFPVNTKKLGVTNKVRLMSRQNDASSVIIYADGPGEAPVHGLNGLIFESRQQFYDFLKRFPNITIPTEKLIKASSNSSSPNLMTPKEAEENKLRYQEFMKNYETRKKAQQGKKKS